MGGVRKRGRRRVGERKRGRRRVGERKRGRGVRKRGKKELRGIYVE